MPYKVHPGIGIARVGNSPDWFIGPETADEPSIPSGGYKDARGRIRRQAARFRVFDHSSAVPVEVATSVEWTVRTATGTVTLTGANAHAPLPEVTLPSGRRVVGGEIRTDAAGRLLLLSSIIEDFAGRADDDIFSGQIQAVIEARVTGSAELVVASWVMVAGPDFAPAMQDAASGYDVLLQRFKNERDAGVITWALPIPTRPSFTRDIYPLAKQLGFARRDPTLVNPLDRPTMTQLRGIPIAPINEYSSRATTEIGLGYLTAWLTGTGAAGDPWDNDWTSLRDVPRSLTAAELDRGPLSHTVGNPLSPGWDFSRSLRDATYGEPFRLATPSPTGFGAVNWMREVRICGDWHAGTAGQSIPTVDWYELGFQIRNGDRLERVEGRASSLDLITPTVDFGRVAREPPLPPSTEPRPGRGRAAVVFESTSSADLEFVTPLPPELSVWSERPVRPAGATGRLPLRLWLTFTTPPPPASGSYTARIQVRHVDATPEPRLYDILVKAEIVDPLSTQVVLVLDRSYSMHEDRGDGRSKLQGLIDATGVIVATARDVDGIGVVPYNHLATDVAPGALDVTPLATPARRTEVTDFVGRLTPEGSTSIGAGLQSARRLLGRSAASFGQSALVVVTDGNETAPPYVREVAGTIDQRTFALGIGTETNVDADTLATLSGNRGGYLLLTGAVAGGVDNQFVLEKFLLQILAGARQDQVILDPATTLQPGTTERIAFDVCADDHSLEVMVLCAEPARLSFTLETPSGDRVSPGSHVEASFERSQRVAFYRVALPIRFGAGLTHRGRWHALLGAVPGDKQQGKPLPCSLLVHARSGVQLQTKVVTDERGLWLEALLTAYGHPFEGFAELSATVRYPSGVALEVPLERAQHGRFVASLSGLGPGLYRVRARARGLAEQGDAFQREHEATAVVGRAAMQPPSLGQELRRALERCLHHSNEDPNAPGGLRACVTKHVSKWCKRQ